MFEPIKSASLADAVIDQLKGSILEGTLQPGDRMPSEQELCTQLQVSRTAIREAKKALIGMGLLETRRGQGTFVRENVLDVLADSIRWGLQMEKGSIQELIEARRIVEVETAALAAERATEEMKQQLTHLILQMQKAIDADDRKAFLGGDVAWHAAMAEAAENRVVTRMIMAIRSFLEVFVDAVLEVPESAAIAHTGHARVTEAIINGDVEEAKEAMQTHLSDVHRMILKRLSSENSDRPI
jgi:GntR family transcriptional repressor for pyruvate dehydrogenase complex